MSMSPVEGNGDDDGDDFSSLLPLPTYLQESPLPSCESTSSTSRSSRIHAKSVSFIHHTHIALSPITDANFAAIVRSVECMGGGIIHRILNSRTAVADDGGATTIAAAAAKDDDDDNYSDDNEGGGGDEGKVRAIAIERMRGGGRRHRHRREINGAEKYVIILNYRSVGEFLSYISDWRASRCRPDYGDLYTLSSAPLCEPRLLASYIPRTDTRTDIGSNFHYSDPLLIDSLQKKQQVSQGDGCTSVVNILLFGSEVTPIDTSLLAAADGTFSIPMYGLSESLNVSNAVAIAFYAVRQTVGQNGDGSKEEDASIEKLLLARSHQRGFISKARRWRF